MYTPSSQIVTETGNGHGVECTVALSSSFGKDYVTDYVVPPSLVIEDYVVDPCTEICGSPVITNPQVPPISYHDFTSDGVYEISEFSAIGSDGVTSCSVTYDIPVITSSRHQSTPWISNLPNNRGIVIDISMGDEAADMDLITLMVTGTSGCNSHSAQMIISVQSPCKSDTVTVDASSFPDSTLTVGDSAHIYSWDNSALLSSGGYDCSPITW